MNYEAIRLYKFNSEYRDISFFNIYNQDFENGTINSDSGVDETSDFIVRSSDFTYVSPSKEYLIFCNFKIKVAEFNREDEFISLSNTWTDKKLIFTTSNQTYSLKFLVTQDENEETLTIPEDVTKFIFLELKDDFYTSNNNIPPTYTKVEDLNTLDADTTYYYEIDTKKVGINWNPDEGLPIYNLSVNGTMSIKPTKIGDNTPKLTFLKADGSSAGEIFYILEGDNQQLVSKYFGIVVGNDRYTLPIFQGTSPFLGIWTTKDLTFPLPINKGGTGATTVEGIRISLSLGNSSGALPITIEQGGTGYTTQAYALYNGLLQRPDNTSKYLTGSAQDIMADRTFVSFYNNSISTSSTKPSLFGFLLNIGEGTHDWHQIWLASAGALYHRSGNHNSTPASVAFKQIIDEDGGTLTGQLTTTINNGFLLTVSSGSAMMRATRSDTGASVGFGVGSGGTNHGVYSYLLNDWLIYANDTETVVKGRCTGTAANVTGTVAVGNGGTGATTFTSGNALIGAGTGAITTRAITNMTSVGGITYNTNLMTTNTLAYWNGRYGSGSGSNLTYYTGGTIYGSGQFGWKRQSMNLSSGVASTACTGVIATSVIAAQRVGTYSDTSGAYATLGASASNAGNIKVFTASGSSGATWTVSLFWTKSATGG